MTDLDELDALEALRAKATPGEWEIYSEPDVGLPPSLFSCVIEKQWPSRTPLERLSCDDMAFIVALHNAAPALIATAREVEAKDAEIARLREALQPLADACEKADRSAADRLHLGMGVMSDTASPGWGVRYGHLKAARAALGAAS